MDTTKTTTRKGQPPTNWPELFLLELAATGSVTAAAKAAHVERSTAYDRRNSDPEFLAAWEDALVESVDALEQEARRRALSGVEEPVYQGGVRVGSIRKFSDTLMIFLLKANDPAKYRERVSIDGKMNHSHQLEEMTGDEIARQIAAMEERIASAQASLDAAAKARQRQDEFG